MTKSRNSGFQRRFAPILAARLVEPRRFLQVVAGPRQVGKTTLVEQVLAASATPTVYASADEPSLRDAAWLAAQWDRGRLAVADHPAGAVLALDEVQKIPGWSETVKRLWDEDSRARRPLRVVLLGSAPLIMRQALTESLAGRFEVLHLPHWSYLETHEAFGVSLGEFLYFGGYPGAAPLIGEPARWRRYLLDALIEMTIARDVLLMTRVDKPALLRRLFELGCRYSGQVLSYTKMLGQLHDAGNATTLAHYLELLSGAGMLTGISKYAGKAVRLRAACRVRRRRASRQCRRQRCLRSVLLARAQPRSGLRDPRRARARGHRSQERSRRWRSSRAWRLHGNLQTYAHASCR